MVAREFGSRAMRDASGGEIAIPLAWFVGDPGGRMRIWTAITPNRVTAGRVLLGAAAIAIYALAGRGIGVIAGAAALALTISAIALDGLDGWLARRLNMASAFGAQFDVLGDRLLENLYFIFFAANGQISVWVPAVFFVRGAVTDFLRSVAARGANGNSADDAETFGRNWMLRSRAGIAIVASRGSRGTYAAMKCLCFCALGLEWTLSRVDTGYWMIRNGVHIASTTIVAATAAFCVLRAVPAVWEGWKYFAEPEHANVESRALNARSTSSGKLREMVIAP
jgi:CDP-diacylglycerol---glycerol-3-phosphate 3-phosphatidyltransferase